MKKGSVIFYTIIFFFCFGMLFIFNPLEIQASSTLNGKYSCYSTVNEICRIDTNSVKSKTIGSNKIKAAKLSKKNKRARRAYKVLLEKKKYRRNKHQKVRYALVDLDRNGIDELFIDTNCDIAAGQVNEVYTFKNGKVKKLVSIPFVTFAVYDDGTFESFYGKSGYYEDKFYYLKNGYLKKRMELEGCDSYASGYVPKKMRKNAERIGVFYWYVKKIGNKNVSYSRCEKWIKKFNSSHKILKLKYKSNTKNNRASMLNNR